MAFNINAHVILQGPKNISAVTSKIKSQLAGINVPVNLQVSQGGKGLGQLNAQLKGVTATAATTNKSVTSLGAAAQRTGASLSKTGAGAGKLKTNLKGISGQANQAAGAMQMLGRETALTFKRFAAAGIVTATVFRLGGAIAESTGKAIEFERELIRLQQVTGKTQAQLRGLKKSVTDLSTGLGIDANELANIARLFAQTGQTLSEVQNSMKAIARSSLAPTFGEMENTAEGLIAALSQFKIAASSSEEVLGSLNRVSKKFAVESQDMIAAIRRAGGVFALAAKQTQEPIEALQEFISIFTAVRSTTRESAETIATGLRTIFTRIQRRGTIDMLRELGINLTDAQGKFVGLFESFKMLSTELDKIIQRGDAVTLSAITEELGGMRQVGKLIPAIREFRKAQRALNEAQRGAAEGLGGDVELGLKPLGKQLEQLSARWDTFIRKVTEGKTFQSLAKMAIDTANAFISLGDAVRPILPLLVSIGATKLAKGAVGFGAGFLGSTKGLGGGGGVGVGLGARVGGVVAGKPSAGAGVSQSNLINALSNNTSAVGPNTSALQSLNTSLKGIPQQFRNLSSEFKNAIGNLRASIDQLKGSISSLGLRGGVGGPMGPMSRGPRRGFSGGGIVRGGRRRGYSSGGRVPLAGGWSGAPYSLSAGPARLTPTGQRIKGKGQVGTLEGGIMGGVTQTGAGWGKKVNARIKSELPTNYGAVFLRAADTPAAKTSGIHFRSIREDLRGSIPAAEILADMSMFKQVPGQKGISKAGLAKAKGLGLTTAGTKGPRVKKSAMKDVRGMLGLGATGVEPFNYILQARSLSGHTSERMQNAITGNVKTAVDEAANVVLKSLPGNPQATKKLSSDMKAINIDQIIGNIFEGALTEAGVPWSNELDSDLNVDPRNPNATFDFTGPGRLKGLFQGLGNGPIDAKATYNSAALASITKKVRTYAAGSIEEILLSMGNPRVGAAGGSASPTDPFNNEGRLEALLMPGEMQIQGVGPGTANQIAGGNLRALFGVDPRKVALVPGVGNRDSVEADLAPGSFIVRKDIAQEALAQGYDPQARFSKRMGAATGGYTSRVGFKAGGRVGFAGGTPQRVSQTTGMWGQNVAAVKQHTVATKQSTQAEHEASMGAKDLALAEHQAADLAQQAAQTRSMAAMNFMGAATSAVFALQMLDFSSFEGSMISVTMLGMAAFQAVEAITALKAASALAAEQELEKIAAGAAAAPTTFMGGFTGTFKSSPLAGLLGKSGGKGGMFTKMSASLKAAAPIFGKLAAASLVAIAGVELGRLAAGKIIDMIYGKTTESKYAEGVEGRAGMTKEQAGGLGAAKGAAGIALGAGIGFALAGPLGALIGVIYGGIKAFKDYNTAIAKQAEFLAFEELGKAADGATEALKNFNKQEGVSATGIQKVNTEMKGYTDRLQGATDAAQKSEYAQRQGPGLMGVGGGAAIGATLGAIFAPFTLGLSVALGAAIGAVAGGITEAIYNAKSAAGLQEDSLTAAEKSLGTLTDKMIEGMNKAFDKIAQDFITNLADTTPHLAAIASLTQSIDMPDLNLSEVTADFEALKGVLEASGEKGKAFSQFLDQKLMVDMMESLKSADDDTKRLFAAATAKGYDITNMDALRDASAQLGAATGQTAEQVQLAIDSMENLNRMHREQLIQQIALAAKMEQLNRTMKNVKSSLDALITGLSIFAQIAGQTTDEFGVFADEVDTFVGRRLDNQFGIQQPGRGAINPLKNLETATDAAFEGAIKKIGMAIGKENAKALGGMKETIKLRKELPMILKNAVKLSEERGGGKIATSEEIFDTLRESAIKLGVEFDDLPDVVKKNLKTSLSTAISRQGGQTAGAAMRKLLESGDLKEVLSKFGEVAEKARESLSNFYDGLTNFQNSLIDILNQLVRLEEYRIDQSLRAIDVVKQSNDAMDRFRIGITSLDDANAHLEERLSAIGGPVTMNPAQQQAQLQEARDENKQIRDLLAAQGGIAIGADMTPQQIEDAMASAIGPLNESQFLLIDALRLNEQAIVRETKKLDELINEQFRLEAATNELGLIQKAQMSAEQLSRLFISKLARIEGETDPRRRAEMLKELMLPFTSFSKAASGMTLNVRELDSVIANFPHLAAVLRSKGYDEKEIAKVRASFFGVFTRDFPDIMKGAFESAGNKLDLSGPVTGLIKSIQKAMEPAGKLFEDLPEVKKIFDEIAAIAAAKKRAIVQEYEDNIKKVKEVIERNLGELKVDRQSLADLAKEAATAGEALRNFSLEPFAGGMKSAANHVIKGLEAAGTELLKYRAQALEEAEEAPREGGDRPIKSIRQYEDKRVELDPGQVGGLRFQESIALLKALPPMWQQRTQVSKGAGPDQERGFKFAEKFGVETAGEQGGAGGENYRTDRNRGSGVGGMAMTMMSVGKLLNELESGKGIGAEREIVLKGLLGLKQGDPLPSIGKIEELLHKYLFQETTGATFGTERIAKGTLMGQLNPEDFDKGLEAYRVAMIKRLNAMSDEDIMKKHTAELASGSKIYGEELQKAEKANLKPLAGGQVGVDSIAAARAALRETAIRRMKEGGDIGALFEQLRKVDEEAAIKLLEPLDLAVKQQIKIADSTERTAKAVEKLAEIETDDADKKTFVGDEKRLGGPIFGASHSRGGVDINAEGGEYVLSRKAVSRLKAKYGAGFLDKLNQGEVPTIAQAGGMIGPVSTYPFKDVGPASGPGGPVTGFEYKPPKALEDLSRCACSTKDEQILQQLLGHVKGQNAEFNDANLNLQAISGAIAEQPTLLENLPSSIKESLAPLFGGIENVAGGIRDAVEEQGKAPVLNAIQNSLESLLKGVAAPIKKMAPSLTALEAFPQLTVGFNKMLDNMGISNPFGSGGGVEDNTKKTAEGVLDSNDLLNNLPDNIKEKMAGLLGKQGELATGMGENFCKCIDKLIAFLAGIPVEIGAEFGKELGGTKAKEAAKEAAKESAKESAKEVAKESDKASGGGGILGALKNVVEKITTPHINNIKQIGGAAIDAVKGPIDAARNYFKDIKMAEQQADTDTIENRYADAIAAGKASLEAAAAPDPPIASPSDRDFRGESSIIERRYADAIAAGKASLEAAAQNAAIEAQMGGAFKKIGEFLGGGGVTKLVGGALGDAVSSMAGALQGSKIGLDEDAKRMLSESAYGGGETAERDRKALVQNAVNVASANAERVEGRITGKGQWQGLESIRSDDSLKRIDQLRAEEAFLDQEHRAGIYSGAGKDHRKSQQIRLEHLENTLKKVNNIMNPPPNRRGVRGLGEQDLGGGLSFFDFTGGKPGIDPDTGFRGISKEEEKRREGLDKTQQEKNMEKLRKHNEERAKKGLRAQTLSQAIAEKKMQQAKERAAKRKTAEDTKDKAKATTAGPTPADKQQSELLKKQMGIQQKEGDATKKQTVELKGGICGCFETAIDKLIAFLMGMPVEISSEFAKELGVGGGAGAKKEGGTLEKITEELKKKSLDIFGLLKDAGKGAFDILKDKGKNAFDMLQAFWSNLKGGAGVTRLPDPGGITPETAAYEQALRAAQRMADEGYYSKDILSGKSKIKLTPEEEGELAVLNQHDKGLGSFGIQPDPSIPRGYRGMTEEDDKRKEELLKKWDEEKAEIDKIPGFSGDYEAEYEKRAKAFEALKRIEEKKALADLAGGGNYLAGLIQQRQGSSAGPPLAQELTPEDDKARRRSIMQLQLQDMVSAITSNIGGLKDRLSDLLGRGGGLLASGLGKLLGGKGGGKKEVVDSSAGGGEGGVASGQAGKMQVQMRGGLFGLCDCFTAAIDKLIAFLAGEEVSIGGGGAGGPGGPGTPGGPGGKGIFEILFDVIKGAGKTILGNFKTIGQGILTAFPKLKPIVDTVVGAFKDIPGTLGAATDFIKDAWGKLGKISDKLKEQKEKEAKAGADAERAGIEEQKKKTKTSLRDRIAKKIQSLKDEGKPVPESLQKKFDDLQKEVGQERNLKEQEGIDKQKEEAIRNREMRKAKSVMPKPILEGAEKLGEFLGKGGLGGLLAQGISGLMPTGAELEASGIAKQKEKTAESLRRRKEAAAKKEAEAAAAALPPGVTDALQNIGGFLGGASNQAAGGIAGAVGNLFKKPGTGAATPVAGGAPTGGALPLDEFMRNMQDPLGFMMYQQEQNKRKYKSQGGRLPDPVGPLSPERLDYLEGIEKTAPRLAGQKDKIAGQETIQRAVGTTKSLQERLARMKANREKIQSQLDQAEKKGLSKDSKIYKSREQRVKNLDESMGAIQSVLDQRAGKDQGFKPNIPGLKPPAYPGGANFPARPPGQQGPTPQGQQQAQQMLKTMGFSSSFAGGQRKVKLTDTPLAAADKIISFLSSACLMTKPCQTAQDPGTAGPGEGGGILGGITDKIKDIMGGLIGVGKGGLGELIKGGIAGFGKGGIGGAIAGGIGGGIGGILGGGSNLLEILLPGGLKGILGGGAAGAGAGGGLLEALLPGVGTLLKLKGVKGSLGATGATGTSGRPNYRGVPGAFDFLDRGEPAGPDDIRRGPFIPGKSKPEDVIRKGGGLAGIPGVKTMLSPEDKPFGPMDKIKGMLGAFSSSISGNAPLAEGALNMLPGPAGKATAKIVNWGDKGLGWLSSLLGDPSEGKAPMNPLEAPGAWNPTGRKNSAPFDAAAMLRLAKGTSIDQSVSRIDAANAERKAPEGNVFEGLKRSIEKLAGGGPLINDETVKMLSTSNDALVNALPNFQASVDRLSQILATNITLSIVAPEKAIPVNVHITGMNEVMNKLQNIITVEIFQGAVDKLQEQIDGLKGSIGPLGGGGTNGVASNTNIN